MPARINVFANVADLRPADPTKVKGAFVSESALHSFDGDKPNSVGPALCYQGAGRMIIHLIRISPNARQIFIRRGATIPEDF